MGTAVAPPQRLSGRTATVPWHSLIVLVVMVILAIPIRRYELPGGLPVQLEPYRLVVALVLAAWFSSLLIDPRLRLVKPYVHAPLLSIVALILCSDLANPGRVNTTESAVTKSLLFFASFVLMVYFVAGVVRSRREIDVILKVLVGGGAIVAALALQEWRTGYNIFDHLGPIVPGLEYKGTSNLVAGLSRGGRLRVFASAEHPIALGAALALLVPMGIYLATTSKGRIWWAAVGVLLLGLLASGSRTAIVMMIVVGLVFLWLRPSHTRRFWPALLPAFVVIHLVLPGAIGGTVGAFLPSEGLIASQQTSATSPGAGGRLTDIGPTVAQLRGDPLFGVGFGTRILPTPGADPAQVNARVLDDQWLAIVLETGIAGTLAWLWLFVGFVKRCGRQGKGDDSPLGWLLCSLAAAVAAYGVGMLTFDAFSFVQVTVIFFILVGIGCAALRLRGSAAQLAST